MFETNAASLIARSKNQNRESNPFFLDRTQELGTSLDKNYGLQESKLPESINRKIIKALQNLKIKNINIENMTYFDAEVPEAYLAKLRHSTDKDKEIAKEPGGIFTWKNDFDGRIVCFVSPKDNEALSRVLGVPKEILHLHNVVHELAHRLIWDVTQGVRLYSELIAEAITSQTIDPQCSLIYAFSQSPNPMEYTGLVHAADDAINQVFTEIDKKFANDDLAVKLREKISAYQTAVPGITWMDAYKKAVADFFNEYVKSAKHGPRTVSKLMDKITKQYASNLKEYAKETLERIKETKG
jgi:hypothetical protein